MSRLIIDSHVHLHPPVHLDRFLSTAWRNLQSAASATAEDACILCLTDMAADDSPALLRAHGGPEWSVTEEDGAFRARGPGDAGLWLLPGRQIASSDGLEVLALDCTQRIPDRSLSLNALVDRVLELGAIPVVPWGFGKWSGARGQLVETLLRSRSDFAVADNGNRLRATSEPPLLQEARQRGNPVLLGSDPLPLKNAFRRAAACGNILENLPADASTPSARLRYALKQPQSLKTYGTLTSPAAFVRSQLSMQLRKHLR